MSKHNKNRKNPTVEMYNAAIRLPNLAKKGLLTVEDMATLGRVKGIMQFTAEIITSSQEFKEAKRLSEEQAKESGNGVVEVSE